jgi:MarR-like DNA-binding transcriptional regulator SgrR of sgrS sRNA
MLMTLYEAYQQFLQNEPSMRVGKSKFCSLRPKWVKTITPHDGCACVYHENPTLLITAWNRINRCTVDLKGLLNEVVCRTFTQKCYARQCDTCGDRLPSDVLLMNFVGDEDDEMTWMQWKKTERRVELQRISGSVTSKYDATLTIEINGANCL